MKTILITLALLISCTTSFSQELSIEELTAYSIPVNSDSTWNDSKSNLRFKIYGSYTRSVKKENLMVAKKLDEICPGYPTNWITDYISIEISSSGNDKSLKAKSTSTILTTDQKNILNNAELGTDILININYKSQNSATDKVEIRSISYAVTVIPEIEADYYGGNQELRKYIKKNAINKITESQAIDLKNVLLKFTVTEVGKIDHALIIQTSGNPETDKILLDAINKMPNWIPAENPKGFKVKQNFELRVSADGC